MTLNGTYAEMLSLGAWSVGCFYRVDCSIEYVTWTASQSRHVVARLGRQGRWSCSRALGAFNMLWALQIWWGSHYTQDAVSVLTDYVEHRCI